MKTFFVFLLLPVIAILFALLLVVAVFHIVFSWLHAVFAYLTDHATTPLLDLFITAQERFKRWHYK